MAKIWIKLYTETLHDRKMWKLKPIEQLTFYYLLMLAGIEDDYGKLPDMDDIELELQMPLKLKRTELDKIIDTLVDNGLIDVRNNVMYVDKYLFVENPAIIRNSGDYSNWRNSVFERDEYTCQYCGQIGGKLNAHHIKKFADYPELRLDLENGITLCASCHRKLHRNEISLVEAED